MLTGRQQEIHAHRDRKLEAARQQREIGRQSPGEKAKATDEVDSGWPTPRKYYRSRSREP
jgi:hypothetical protein